MTWHDYLEELSTEDNSYTPLLFNQRLKDWLARFDMYDLEDNSFTQIKNWRNRKNLRREAEKLRQALLALKESDGQLSTEATKAIKDVIHIQMTKLELTQLRMLQKAQNLKRFHDELSLDEAKENLAALRKISRTNIQGRKIPFSKEIDANDYPLTVAFFKSHEGTIHFSEHFKKSDRIADSINLIGALNTFFTRIARIIATISAEVLNVLQSAGILLQAIPFINAIASSIPIIILAAKTWIRDSGKAKKITYTILLGVVLGGIIASGFGTIAIAVAAVSLMALGLIVKHIHPWIMYRLEIRRKKNEIVELENTIKGIEKDNKPIIINSRERQFLMTKLEEAWLKANDNERIQLKQLRNKILTHDYAELDQDNNIKKLIGGDLKKFITDEMQARIGHLKFDITDSKSALVQQEQIKRYKSLNGLLALAGAILICVPTPITWIIGGSLLVVSGVIGIAIAFRWDIKFRNLFKSKTPEAPSTSNVDDLAKNEHGLAPRVTHVIDPVTKKAKLVHTNINDNHASFFYPDDNKKMKPTPEPVYTNGHEPKTTPTPKKNP